MDKVVPSEPMWFDKPLSALLLPGQNLKLDPAIHRNIHYEVEMGVVIGMQGRNIKKENVDKHIAGYFLGIDFCNREMQGLNKNDGSDWYMAKGSN